MPRTFRFACNPYRIVAHQGNNFFWGGRCGLLFAALSAGDEECVIRFVRSLPVFTIVGIYDC